MHFVFIKQENAWPDVQVQAGTMFLPAAKTLLSRIRELQSILFKTSNGISVTCLGHAGCAVLNLVLL